MHPPPLAQVREAGARDPMSLELHDVWCGPLPSARVTGTPARLVRTSALNSIPDEKSLHSTGRRTRRVQLVQGEGGGGGGSALVRTARLRALYGNQRRFSVFSETEESFEMLLRDQPPCTKTKHASSPGATGASAATRSSPQMSSTSASTPAPSLPARTATRTTGTSLARRPEAGPRLLWSSAAPQSTVCSTCPRTPRSWWDRPPPPPPPRTNRTRLVPSPVLTGHVSSLLLQVGPLGEGCFADDCALYAPRGALPTVAPTHVPTVHSVC